MQELSEPKGGYKQTELGLIPNQWMITGLSQVGLLRAGGTPSRFRKEYWENGTIPWLSSGEVRNNIITSSDEKITELGLAESAAKLFPKGTVLIAITGQGLTRGRTALLSIDSTTNQSVVGIIHKKDVINNIFLWYYLQYQYWKLRSISQGTNQAGLNLELLGSYRILLPPIHEQEKIASIISKADELIQKTDQIIEQTQRLKKGLMQKLLIEGIGHRKYKSVRFGPHFLNYDIPDKWQVLTLKQSVRGDTPITYGIVQAGPHIPAGVPYIRTGDMSGDKLSIDDMLRTSKEIASSSRRSQVKAGEIVCALRGIVGKVLEVPEELEDANLTQGTARISPRHGIYNRYLLWALQSEYARKQFEIFSKGTTLNEITLEQLRAIKVAIPSDIKEQKDLSHILDRLESAIALQMKYKERLVMLKAGLMQKLLTGKIRVKV
jgi:type I restriction enzyme, S subunit